MILIAYDGRLDAGRVIAIAALPMRVHHWRPVCSEADGVYHAAFACNG
jgi:hypothetical protein